MSEPIMRKLGERFIHRGRSLITLPSEEGCDGCYFNQKGLMSCKNTDCLEASGPCSAEEREDKNDVRFILDGPHVKLDRLPEKRPDDFELNQGSVFKPEHINANHPHPHVVYKGINIPLGCVSFLKVKLKEGYYHPELHKLYKRHETFDFVSCNLIDFFVFDNDKGGVQIPCKHVQHNG